MRYTVTKEQREYLKRIGVPAFGGSRSSARDSRRLTIAKRLATHHRKPLESPPAPSFHPKMIPPKIDLLKMLVRAVERLGKWLGI